MFDGVDNFVSSGSRDPNSDDDDDDITAFSALLVLFDVRLSLCV